MPEGTKGHVILTGCDPVTIALAEKLRQYHHDYAIVIEDLQKAMEYQDLDFQVVVGELGNPLTYRKLRVEDAALVVANADDMTNTNIAFTVREISRTVTVVANADNDDSVDILELAGSTHVFQFTKMLGQSLARRVLGTTTRANVIGKFESFLIAEAPAMRTPLVGKTLSETRIRVETGCNVIAICDQNTTSTNPDPSYRIKEKDELILIGPTEAEHLFI